jgi:hypothetical protein
MTFCVFPAAQFYRVLKQGTHRSASGPAYMLVAVHYNSHGTIAVSLAAHRCSQRGNKRSCILPR